MASHHTQRHLVGAHRLVSARPRQPGTQRAGLTSKPHHAQRPQVALRGSFCLRLASTFNHRPARSPRASYARSLRLLPRDVRTRRTRAATRAGGSGRVTSRSSGHRRSAGWPVRIAVATERPLGVPGGRAISLRLSDRGASTVALVTFSVSQPFPRPCRSPPSREGRQVAVNLAGAHGRPAGSRPRRMGGVEIDPNGTHRIPRRNAFSVLDMARLNFVVHVVCHDFFHQPCDVSSTPVLDIWRSGRQKAVTGEHNVTYLLSTRRPHAGGGTSSVGAP